MNEVLQGAQMGVAMLTGAGAALLGLMFYNSSLINPQRFTSAFLKVLSVSAVAKALEIGGAVYRTSQIETEAIPVDATVVALIGRGLEMASYLYLVWFLLRPETKRALNGGGAGIPVVKSGEMPPEYWRNEVRTALTETIKPEFLK